MVIIVILHAKLESNLIINLNILPIKQKLTAINNLIIFN